MAAPCRRGFCRKVGLEPLEARDLPAGVMPVAAPATPAVSTPTLHVAAATAPDGDDVAVCTPVVVLWGQAAPGSSVSLRRVTASGRPLTVAGTTADARGDYHFRVRCATGTTVFAARADGGTSASVSPPLSVIRADQVVVWNTVALQAVRTARLQAPEAARALAIVQVSVYDAVNAVYRRYRPYAVDPRAAPETSPAAAAVAAAYTALVGLFPGQSAVLGAEMAVSLASAPGGRGGALGVALGASVAGQILALRAHDGSAREVAYDPVPGPDVWSPTPPAFAAPVDPQWGGVTPFALTSGTQFRPPPPPPYDSAEFAAEVDTVATLGGADSTVRTPGQTAAARFWSDPAGTFDPPGHWNQIAGTAAVASHAGLEDSARTFALLDMALADAGVEAWGVKYEYDAARPVAVIRDGLGGANPLVTADPTWTPLWSTPAFPSYVSGHSAFSAAAAAVLDSAYGTHFAFNDPGDLSLHLAPRHFASFDDAAREAGASRVYGGIHFPSDNLAGLWLGGEVGRYVVGHELLPAETARA